ncbi:MAG: GSCFA domain-containing protein [Bacteroidales bacterium]|nr:GSCFA domain-containing protein [Bacteroidales bacterium]
MSESEKINFRTVIKPVNFDFEISYKSKTMFIGSCFTENIGKKLTESKFNIDINPFGILYNPVSIKNSLDILLEKRIFTKDDIFYHNEQWHSYFHHSRFSKDDKNKILDDINVRINNSSEYLKNADYLSITFGTSWIFENIESGNVVSNCHKVPAKMFKRRLLTETEISEIYFGLLNRLKEFNPELKIIFTVSPVRHLKDGFAQNSLSKSLLRTATERIINDTENCCYFPAFEIMNDDLRDYRFYNSDMLHPNELAINYIFNYFKSSFFSNETVKIYKEIKKIIKAKQHRAFFPNSPEYKKFATYNVSLIEKINKEFSFIDFSEELSFFRNI